jgi:hypothetical protein
VSEMFIYTSHFLCVSSARITDKFGDIRFFNISEKQLMVLVLSFLSAHLLSVHLVVNNDPLERGRENLSKMFRLYFYYQLNFPRHKISKTVHLHSN